MTTKYRWDREYWIALFLVFAAVVNGTYLFGWAHGWLQWALALVLAATLTLLMGHGMERLVQWRMQKLFRKVQEDYARAMGSIHTVRVQFEPAYENAHWPELRSRIDVVRPLEDGRIGLFIGDILVATGRDMGPVLEALGRSEAPETWN